MQLHIPDNVQRRLRFNTLNGRVELLKPGSNHWLRPNWGRAGGMGWVQRQIQAYTAQRTGADLKSAYPTRMALRDYLSTLQHTAAVDPFREWLEALPDWDGVPWLDRWMADLAGVDMADPLNRWVARHIVCDPIRRTYDPAYRCEFVPVLWGWGTCGARELRLRYLLPEGLDWLGLYGLIPPGQDNPYRNSLAWWVRGAVIATAGNACNYAPHELPAVRDYLLDHWDGGAVGYRRRCVIVCWGLPDGSCPYAVPGDERWLFVEVPGGKMDGYDCIDYKRVHLEQIWAHGLHVVRNNDFAPPPGVAVPAAGARRISGALLTAETCHAN